MKKVLLIAMMMANVVFANAQNYMRLVLDTVPQTSSYQLCSSIYDGIIIIRNSSGTGYPWDIFNWDVHYYNHDRYSCSWFDAGTSYYYQATDSVLLTINNPDYVAPNYPYSDEQYDIMCRDANGNNLKEVYVTFYSSQIQYPFLDSIAWKRKNETISIRCYESNCVDLEFLWSSGEEEREISVITPDSYSVSVSNGCATETFGIEVRDNVELYRATVDLETNLNKTTWQTTPEQAEYINEVKVYRDGLLVGTAPYEQGYYLDAIGSDNAARNYRIVGVSVEGEDCPIESFEKGTIHTTYYQDVNSNLNMTWNVPYVEEGAQGTLTYFQICKYNPNTGEITVVDQVNAAITDYTCGVNQFDGGQAVIAAVFNDGRGTEELSFSNLTNDILGIEEDGPSTGSGTLTVYPNPAKDRVTVEGTGTMTVTNTLGQTILTKEIDGKATIDLPQGLYFVKLNGITRKIVVE